MEKTMNRPKIIVICGPTASGKTSLGIQVANRINGEIISCDSMQIYKEMNIGTAKPTIEEQKQAIHHLIDFVEPTERYSVAQFKLDADKNIKEIISKGKSPILVGGTGLYINSLIYNIEYKEISTNLEYRKSLESVDLQELYEKAKLIDNEAVSKISNTDRKRLSRILELYNTTGKTKTQLEKESRKELQYDYKIFVLNMPREILYDRINKRVDLMIKNGLIEEVSKLLKKYNEFPTAMQGLGYKEVKEYLDGTINKEEMIEKVKQESRRYAKRQLTWFRTYKDATWLEAGNTKNVEIISNSII